MDRSKYQNPLGTRYAGKEMSAAFSDERRFRLWRRLWITLAQCQKELGLDITDGQIAELERYAEDINYQDAERRERECRHDVMSHVYAYGLQCPSAAGIIHLGATSCYVTDNSELIAMYDGLKIVRKKLLSTIQKLARFAKQHKALPTLGFTHFQPAQLTTVGKRACLWLADLHSDYIAVDLLIQNFALRGAKGTTGTQASFLQLFGGDHQKVRKLDKMIAQRMGFSRTFPVTGQTYPRKTDYAILSVLSQIAQSAYRFSNDIRLLQGLKEIEEPFESAQIGSSAMAYKRNPMRSERISALARFLISLPMNSAVTASTQWFERTLDDSANRRLVNAQAFLTADAILNIYLNVAESLVVYPKVIERRIREELPFMATETILMECVKAGGDRQELHERIRVLSMQAAARVKHEGRENNLIELIKADPAFAAVAKDLDGIMRPEQFTGRASEQVDEYLSEHINPLLAANQADINEEGEVNI